MYNVVYYLCGILIEGGKAMTKEQIYERMTVQLVTPDPEIPCEFDNGKPCAQPGPGTHCGAHGAGL